MVTVASSVLDGCSAITSRSASRALAWASCRQRSTDTRRGLVDHPGERRLAGAEPDRRGGLDLIVDIVALRRCVHDPRDAEIEPRAGPHVDHDRHRRPQVDVERQVGNLLPGGADADDRAVVARGIERGEQAPVVAARLRDAGRRRRRRGSPGRSRARRHCESAARPRCPSRRHSSSPCRAAGRSPRRRPPPPRAPPRGGSRRARTRKPAPPRGQRKPAAAPQGSSASARSPCAVCLSFCRWCFD